MLASIYIFSKSSLFHSPKRRIVEEIDKDIRYFSRGEKLWKLSVLLLSDLVPTNFNLFLYYFLRRKSVGIVTGVEWWLKWEHKKKGIMCLVGA
jgi:hypothetical protein